jgi:hypothetical protein
MAALRPLDVIRVPETGHTPTLADAPLAEMIGRWIEGGASSGFDVTCAVNRAPSRVLFAAPAAAAAQLALAGIGVILCAPLARTRRTAEIAAAGLPRRSGCCRSRRCASASSVAQRGRARSERGAATQRAAAGGR